MRRLNRFSPRSPGPKENRRPSFSRKKRRTIWKSSTATISLFTQKRVPCTFFCAPGSALKDPARVQAIASNPLFEIALRGTDFTRHQRPEQQKALILSGKQTLETLSGRTVLGFSPFEALYDSSTVAALLEMRAIPIWRAIRRRGRRLPCFKPANRVSSAAGET